MSAFPSNWPPYRPSRPGDPVWSTWASAEAIGARVTEHADELVEWREDIEDIDADVVMAALAGDLYLPVFRLRDLMPTFRTTRGSLVFYPPPGDQLLL